MNQIDKPEEFDKVSTNDQKIVITWIKENIMPRKTPNDHHTSYGIKHLFEHDIVGFYMTNGAFKGAMLVCGYKPVNKDGINWAYKISEKSLAFKRKA